MHLYGIMGGYRKLDCRFRPSRPSSAMPAMDRVVRVSSLSWYRSLTRGRRRSTVTRHGKQYCYCSCAIDSTLERTGCRLKRSAPFCVHWCQEAREIGETFKTALIVSRGTHTPNKRNIDATKSHCEKLVCNTSRRASTNSRLARAAICRTWILVTWDGSGYRQCRIRFGERLVGQKKARVNRSVSSSSYRLVVMDEIVLPLVGVFARSDRTVNVDIYSGRLDLHTWPSLT